MGDKKIAEFPEVENKLQAPTKKSVFERQKEAEREKRLQEEAETAAVYEDFVKSFDDEEAPTQTSRFKQEGAFGGYGGVNGPPKRHFGSGVPTGPSSGRSGSGGGGRGFGSGPGSLGHPPPNLSRKRQHDGFQPPSRNDRRDSDRGLLAFEDYESSVTPLKAFNTSDDEEATRRGQRSAEPAVAKPTLRLARSLPAHHPLLSRHFFLQISRSMPCVSYHRQDLVLLPNESPCLP